MSTVATNMFSGKTVVITGASAGVGAACAHAFAEQKANLVLAARGQQGLDKIAAELSTLTDVETVQADMQNLVDCEKLLKLAEQRFGRVDVLVNNAGMHVRGDVEQNRAEDFAAMVDINLRAPIVLTTAAIPLMRKAGGGAVVMVGSLAGMAPLQGAATYSATKAGLRAFTYALADEVRDSGIQVAVVSPGPIDTGFIMDEMDKVEDIVFSQPMSTAKEVADNIVRLASTDEVEIVMPAKSGKLVNLGYLFPKIRRKMRPALYKKGRANKEKYRARNLKKED